MYVITKSLLPLQIIMIFILLATLLIHLTGGQQQYPDCNLNCRRSGECDVFFVIVQHDMW